MANVTARPNWLNPKGEVLLIPETGTKLSSLLPNNMMKRLSQIGCYCQINGETQTYDKTKTGDIDWLDYEIQENDTIYIGVLPAGADGTSERSQNKQLMNAVIMIALVVATNGTAFAVSHPGIYAGALIATSVTLGLVNRSEIKIPEPASFDNSTKEYYALTGNRNQLKPWGRIPRIYGKIRVFPNLAYVPLQDFGTDASHLEQLFDFGYSELEISDIRLGTNSIDVYDDAEFKVHKNVQGPNFELGANIVGEPVGRTFEYLSSIEKKFSAGTVSADISIFFPTNMVWFNMGGSSNRGYYGAAFSHVFKLEYSDDAGKTWKIWTPTSPLSILLSEYYDKNVTPRNYGLWGLGTFAMYLTYPGGNNNQDYGSHAITCTLTINKKPNIEPTPLASDVDIRLTYMGVNSVASHDPNGVRIYSVPDREPDKTIGIYKPEAVHPDTYTSKGYGIPNNGFRKSTGHSYPQWIYTKTTGNVSVVNPLVPHSMLFMRIKATKQLNGTVENLSAVAHSILKVWYFDTTTNTWKYKKELSSNPAWIFCDILTSEAVNKRAIIPIGEVPDRIDLEEMVVWANECDANHFNCNIVFSDPLTVKECLNIVAGIGRAIPVQPDGIFTVVRESKDRLPIQLITPKNSNGLSVDLNYKSKAQGLSIEYLDEWNDYKATKEILYTNGYNATTAINIDTFSLRGVTNRDQAYRLAWTYLAEYALRRESINFNMDIENLVATRGDVVRVAHDVLSVGGQYLRVTKVVGNQITFDETPNSAISAIRLRGSNAVIPVTVTGEFTVDAPTGHHVKFDDLLEFGVSTSIVADYVITNIRPTNDLNATITALEHRPEIIEAGITGVVPPRIPKPGYDGYYPIGIPRQLLINDYDIIEDRQSYRKVVLYWSVPELGYARSYDVYDISQEPNVFIGNTRKTFFETEKIHLSLLNMHPYTVKYGVVAINNEGSESRQAKIEKHLALNEKKPENVTGFGSNILTSTIHLFWNQVSNRDLDSYEIRYHPTLTTKPKWDESTFVTKEASFNQSSVTVPARTGSYLIKGLNTSNVYSKDPGVTYTHVDVLPQLDLKATYTFDPFAGGLHLALNTRQLGNRLILKDGVYEGWWIAPDAIDFGASAWTMRLTANIDMHHHDHDEHLDKPWFTPLATAIPLSPSSAEGRNKIDAQIYYLREQENFTSDVLADPWFNPLSDAIPLVGYDSPLGPGHTGWQRLISTDVTSNKIQFAIKLTTTDLNFIPAVTSASVLVDWHERVEKGEDLTVPPTGTLDIMYQYKYAEITTLIKKPVVTVSLENAKAGDTVSIVQTAGVDWNEGFTVKLADKDGNPTAGQIDWKALGVGKGY